MVEGGKRRAYGVAVAEHRAELSKNNRYFGHVVGGPEMRGLRIDLN
jgi:hypothetical protein